MTRDEAKALVPYIPFISALADGKRVEMRAAKDQWYEITDPKFDGPVEYYRIAPETPAVGSLEWVKTLLPETKVWRNTMPTYDFAYVRNLADEAPLSGWFMVGTAEWANALPEGTKVRHKAWSGSDGWFARKGSEWFNHKGRPVIMDGSLWELYREPSIRPWKPEEVPVGKTVRLKGRDESRMILSRVAGEIQIAAYGTVDADQMTRDWELTDGSPCGVEEAR